MITLVCYPCNNAFILADSFTGLMVKFDATDSVGFADVQIVLKKVDARWTVELVQQNVLSVCLAICTPEVGLRADRLIE